MVKKLFLSRASVSVRLAFYNMQSVQINGNRIFTSDPEDN